MERRATSLVPAMMALLVAAPAAAKPVQVRLETSLGTIVVEPDLRRAPVSAANFLRYVDAGRFDGARFYRAARNKYVKTDGLIQGGINHDATKAFSAIAHEPTSRTGLRHGEGTISMARTDPGTAMGDFFITLGPAAYLDARPGYPGYAAFGKVVSGMAVARRILALPTYPGGWPALKGQTIIDQPRILRARRAR